MHSWWLFALVGCYRPAAYDDCQVVCGAEAPGSVCPVGQSCDGTGHCRSADRGDCTVDEIPPDAFMKLDAPVDTPNAGQHCFDGFFDVCIDATVADRHFTTDELINTNDCTFVQVQASPPNVCVIVGKDITIPDGVTVRAVGPLPVAFVAYNTITIGGTVIVASRRGLTRGAGAGSGGCNAAAMGSKATTNGGGGGGAGGGMQFNGGKGGSGTGNSAGGNATPKLGAVSLIRGGCGGANGGVNPNGQGAGLGANGGGGAHFVARTSIELLGTAAINASGAGAAAAGPRAGGGGGGSGGFIGFQAPVFTIAPSARVFAIGGGGGAGGGNASMGLDGYETSEPVSTMDAIGLNGGGTGGRGTAEDGIEGLNGIPAGGGTAGGGGGGGGAGGYIGAQGGQFTGGVLAPPLNEL